MKFVDLTTKYHITREKIKLYASVICILLVSVFASLCVYAALNEEAKAEIKRRDQQADKLYANITETTFEPMSTLGEETEPSEIAPSVNETESETSETEPEVILDETTSETTSETTTEATTATSETTEATTAATTTQSGPNEVEYYTTVYASQSLNLRSGPGVEYDIVRTLDAGDQIDVIAQTDTGWYKTYSGNYVMSRYTQSAPLATTAAATQAAATTTHAPTAQTTAAQSSGGSSGTSGMTYYGTCRITFYGPVPLGDGTYSTTTATGTSCSQGRTVAADWSIFPAGTTIYIANDPLGGDGYYTVEDRGSGVNGSHIDIYADNGESLSTTSAEVYVVN